MPCIAVSLDLETTSLDPNHDATLEIGAVKFRGDETIERLRPLVIVHISVVHRPRGRGPGAFVNNHQ